MSKKTLSSLEGENLPPHPTIDFSRTISLPRLVAIGSSSTMSLGIFVLMGTFLNQTGPQTPSAYLVAALIFLPLVLTYAERASVLGGSGGIFSLVRASGVTWRTYASGWLMLGGQLALIALLGIGAALYLNMSIERLIGLSLDIHWLAPSLVILVAVNDLIGTRGRWRLRLLIVYGSIAFLLVLSFWGWFLPVDPTSRASFPSSDSVNMLRVIALMAAGLWGINFVLDKRDEVVEPERNILPGLLIPLGLSAVLGSLAAFVELRTVGFLPADVLPLAKLAKQASSGNQFVLEAICVTFGLLISVVALDKAMVVMVRLMGTMVRDGFLPEQFLKISPALGTPLAALRFFAVVGALTAAFAPRSLLVGFVAISFLWVTALLNLPDVFRRSNDLPEHRRLQLPFYPLFPGLAAGISLFLPFYLPPNVVLLAVGWIALGAIYYVRYARQGNINVRRRDAVVSNIAVDQRRAGYTVLVSTANPETAPALIRMGAKLARARNGRVLVLKVAVFPDQVPQYLQRQEAEKQWLELKLIARRVKVQDVPIEVLVRMSQSPIDGILGAAQEEHAHVILLGWEGEIPLMSFDTDPVLDPIVRAAPCDVVVVRGDISHGVQNVLVPTEGSPNSLAALKLAQHLVVDEHTAHIVALNLVEEFLSPDSISRATTRLQELVNRVGGKPEIDLLVLPSNDIREGILDVAPNFDVLILGASRGGVLDQVIFGGLPVDVARESPCPVLLIKHYEGARRFWLRRAWEMISSPFPVLTVSERDTIYHEMQRAAHPSIDFFILIGLSAMIATLGLIQSSPAVIIGAMLVAPLMSPIISMAMSIVRGNPYLLRMSAGSMLQGIVLALGVSIGVTLLSPTHINTSEILARTQPTLLDLLVALASGAAGGYALGRKEVAAALPGVAIAAALVPPLSVAGYGTATAQLDVSGGALLLFITNLIAIVFAASVVFLLLGFRPEQARLHGHVRTGFLLAMIALVLISIPLAIFSVNAIDKITRQSKVEAVLSAEIESEVTRITDVVVEQQGGRFIVYATIYALDDFSPQQVEEIEQRLQRAVNAPVTLRATVLRAVLLPGRGNVFLPTATPVP